MSQTQSQQLVIKSDEEDTQHGKYLTFPLGKEVFGVGIKDVTEIIGIQAITYVPDVPEYVKGIINLRGKIIPVIDIRAKFKKPAVEYTDRTCIIVVDYDETTIGFIVDCVTEVVDIKDDDIVPPPAYKSGYQNKYIKGIGKVGDDIKMLLDCQKIIADDDEQIITKK